MNIGKVRLYIGEKILKNGWKFGEWVKQPRWYQMGFCSSSDIDSLSCSPGCKCRFNAQLGNKSSQGCSIFFEMYQLRTGCKWCPWQQLKSAIANWLLYQTSEVQHRNVQEKHWAPLRPSDLVVRNINTLLAFGYGHASDPSVFLVGSVDWVD